MHWWSQQPHVLLLQQLRYKLQSRVVATSLWLFFVSLTFFLALFCLWFLCGTHDRNSRLDCGSTLLDNHVHDSSNFINYDTRHSRGWWRWAFGCSLIYFCGFYVAPGEIQDESWESGRRRQSLVDNHDHKNRCFVNYDTKHGWRWWHCTFGCSFLSSSTFLVAITTWHHERIPRPKHGRKTVGGKCS